jgi:hypothetical protein
MGVRFVESGYNVALGIDIEANKDPLALVEGSTENASLVTERSFSGQPRRLQGVAPELIRLPRSVRRFRSSRCLRVVGRRVSSGLRFYADELQA